MISTNHLSGKVNELKSQRAIISIFEPLSHRTGNYNAGHVFWMPGHGVPRLVPLQSMALQKNEKTSLSVPGLDPGRSIQTGE